MHDVGNRASAQDCRWKSGVIFEGPSRDIIAWCVSRRLVERGRRGQDHHKYVSISPRLCFTVCTVEKYCPSPATFDQFFWGLPCPLRCWRRSKFCNNHGPA
eukprot:8564397-Karenia_brevis.AAC.1